MRIILISICCLFLTSCTSAPVTQPPKPKPNAPHFWSYKDPEYPALIKVAPPYPTFLMKKGIEGWVLVEYSLDKTGNVVNPSAVDSSPEVLFDEIAVKAISKWKYLPRVALKLNESDRKTLQRLVTFELQK